MLFLFFLDFKCSQKNVSSYFQVSTSEVLDTKFYSKISNGPSRGLNVGWFLYVSIFFTSRLKLFNNTEDLIIQ